MPGDLADERRSVARRDRAGGEEDRDRQVLEPTPQVKQQPQARLVGEVDVVHGQHERPLLGEAGA